jgi:MFS family permease
MERDQIVRRNTILLTGAQAAIQMAFPVMLVVGGVASSELTGNDGATGVLWALYFVSAASGAFVIGRWMDRVGRRPGLVAAYAIAGVSGIACAVAVSLESYPMLLLAGIPFGVSLGGANLGRGAVADMYPPERRGRAIGWMLAAGTIGAVGSPLLVAVLQSFARDRSLDPLVLPWVLVPVGAIAAISCVLAVRPDPKDLAVATEQAVGGRRPRELLGLRPFRTAVVAAAIGQMAMVGIMGVTPSALHALHHGDTAISIVISTHIAGMFALGPAIGWWMDRVGRRWALVGGCLASIAGALVCSTQTSAQTVGLGLFVIGIGWSATFLGATAVISDVTAPDERAGALGFTDLVVSLSSAAAGLAGGMILESFGYRPLGLSVAIVVATVLVLVVRTRDRSVVAAPVSGAEPVAR